MPAAAEELWTRLPRGPIGIAWEDRRMHPARYVIVVDGVLPQEELGEFVGMHVTQGSRTTVLRGIVKDQAALVGMIARIEALGGEVRDCQATGLDVGSGDRA